MGIWIIEALTIKDKLEGVPQKALFTALVANIITTLLGLLLGWIAVTKIVPIKGFFPYDLVGIFIFFFASILIEAVVLHFYYRQEAWNQIFTTSFWMNLKSYIFLLAFLALDMLVVGSILLTIIIVPYFFLKTFEILSSGKKISKFNKTIATILIIILSFALCLFVFIRIGGKIEKPGRDLARDARVKADMAQMRDIAKVIYSEEGSYKNFSCQYEEKMRLLCNDIEEQINKKPTLYTSEQEYCAYIELKTGRFYCIDSTRKSEEYGKEPSNTCNGNAFKCSQD
jgi:hypothetical protein